MFNTFSTSCYSWISTIILSDYYLSLKFILEPSPPFAIPIYQRCSSPFPQVAYPGSPQSSFPTPIYPRCSYQVPHHPSPFLFIHDVYHLYLKLLLDLHNHPFQILFILDVHIRSLITLFYSYLSTMFITFTSSCYSWISTIILHDSYLSSMFLSGPSSPFAISIYPRCSSPFPQVATPGSPQSSFPTPIYPRCLYHVPHHPFHSYLSSMLIIVSLPSPSLIC